MAKAIAEIRSLARGHTEAAIECLVGVMTAAKAPPSARVAAANSILDRGWGKAPQPLTGDEDGDNPINVVTRIIREIVPAKPE